MVAARTMGVDSGRMTASEFSGAIRCNEGLRGPASAVSMLGLSLVELGDTQIADAGSGARDDGLIVGRIAPAE